MNMDHNIEPEANSALLCLGSVVNDEASLCELQSTGIDVYEFDDVDEYLQYLLSLIKEDTCIYVWLGFGWNHLVSILNDLEIVYYIYLSEPMENEPATVKVQGVFTDAVILVRQILIDERTYQSYHSTHLNVLNIDEKSMVLNAKTNMGHSMWSTVLVHTLIRMPTQTTDIYRAMLDEARLFYKNNPVQLSNIDKFEKEYRKEDAINWYSRDSFTYRLMNKAFRTKNLAILFKFRAFIRDVYEQLLKLHQEQNLTPNTTNSQQSIIRLYRAMKVSVVEGNYLKCCQNGTIVSLNSFVSTSRNPDVATMFLGSDPQRDIMFEISIDLTLLDSISSPFADIVTLSANPDEEEVLLSMGTILQIQSKIIDSKKKIMYIKACVCDNENREVKELKTYLLKNLLYGRDELYYMLKLEQFLFDINDYKNLEKIRKLRKLNTKSNLDELRGTAVRLQNETKHMDSENHTTSCIVNTLSRGCQLLEKLEKHVNQANLMPPEISRMLGSIVDLLSSLKLTERDEELENSSNHILSAMFSSYEQIVSSLNLPALHPYNTNMQRLKDILKMRQNGLGNTLENLEADQLSSIASWLDDDTDIWSPFTNAMLLMSNMNTLGDRSLEFLESLNNASQPKASILNQLALYHETHDDLPMAITYYRTIIEECELPPNSLRIVRAYHSIGSAFAKLYDAESASWNYRQAHNLLLQHHQTTDDDIRLLISRIILSELELNIQQFEKSFVN